MANRRAFTWTLADVLLLPVSVGVALFVWQFYSIIVASIIAVLGACVAHVDASAESARKSDSSTWTACGLAVTLRLYALLVASAFAFAMSIAVCVVLFLWSIVPLNDLPKLLRVGSLAGATLGVAFPRVGITFRLWTILLYTLLLGR